MPEMSQMNPESWKKFFFDSLKDIFLGMTIFKHLSPIYSINTSDFCKCKLILSYFLKTFN